MGVPTLVGSDPLGISISRLIAMLAVLIMPVVAITHVAQFAPVVPKPIPILQARICMFARLLFRGKKLAPRFTDERNPPLAATDPRKTMRAVIAVRELRLIKRGSLYSLAATIIFIVLAIMLSNHRWVLAFVPSSALNKSVVMLFAHPAYSHLNLQNA